MAKTYSDSKLNEPVTSELVNNLLSGKPQSYVGEYQNSLLCNYIFNRKIIVELKNHLYEVCGTHSQYGQLTLYPLVNGIRRGFELTWGNISFTEALRSGEIKFVNIRNNQKVNW